MEKHFSGDKSNELWDAMYKATQDELKIASILLDAFIEVQHMEDTIAEQVGLLVDRLMAHLQDHPGLAGEVPSVTDEKPKISWAWDDRKGWICPRCHRVNGPHVDQCNCSLWTSTYVDLAGRTISG